MRRFNKKIIRKKRLQSRQDRIMTLANLISISRIILSIPLILFLDANMLLYAFIIILLIVASDFLDGYVARKADEITNFGKLIDPVADKICMMIVAIYLIITFKLPFLLFFVILAIRDTFLIIIGIYLVFSQEEVFQSNLSGKWFMGISTLMMALFIFYDSIGLPVIVPSIFYMISTILFVISTFEYVKRYFIFFKKLDVK
ncbi:MAG: CDP-alcohol phosphatidyltransferase family protein [Candidatus Neomarinimicrobiota bacterium]|nr:CDP-alcohol phosphatidyltransferase family protein [Candidatus Neomarinimicrobiota bacterium]|tara:strand:- start:623 stop:1225 length:603 start_codon:yes stop_codon:yes gene_type:complete